MESCPIFIVDVGSPTETIEFFKECGTNFYPQKRKGMGTGKREAVNHATEDGLPIIEW